VRTLHGTVPHNLAADRYRAIFARRSPAELSAIAHLKRFGERYAGDNGFRQEILGGGAAERVAERHGIDLDPSHAALYDAYSTELNACRVLHQQAGRCAETNPRFDAWRQRQICRCAAELGAIGGVITHPIIAFELSAGCSIGCWFCAVSAGRFTGSFAYTPDNAALWREILGVTLDLFGNAAQTGFCYWATDPSDNPDYPRFIEDFYFATGNLPQTTTAAPLRDLGFTRTILRLYDEYRCFINRFSITSLKLLNDVHATFTPEELLGVELVLLNPESLTQKALAGRARDAQSKKRDPAAARGGVAVAPEQTTIACVSGFVVNMVHRRIQLVSPTSASDRWPLGYRTYGERHFETAGDLRSAIEDLIASHMPQEITSADVMCLREDVRNERIPSGFELAWNDGRLAIRGFSGASLLGDMLREGKHRAGEIQSELMRAGADVLATACALQGLFERGLVNDDPEPGTRAGD